MSERFTRKDKKEYWQNLLDLGQTNVPTRLPSRKRKKSVLKGGVRKKARVAAVDDSARNTDGLFFSRCRIYIAQKLKRKIFADITPKKVEIFETQIKSHGGEICSSVEGCTHLVVSEDAKPEMLEEVFGPLKNLSFKLVTPAWISVALMNKRLHSTDMYSPLPTTDTRYLERMGSTIQKVHETGNIKKKNNNNDAVESYSAINHNSNITDILEKMGKMYKVCGDHGKWRRDSYRKAIALIKRWPCKIKKAHVLYMAKKVKGIGKTLQDNIIEILETGKMQRYEEKIKEPELRSLMELIEIWGVGETTARKWYKRGVKTVEEARRRVAMSGNTFGSPKIRIGLKYFEDIKLKIPRAEIKEVEDFLKRKIQLIEPGSKLVIAGSYRRGNLQSGDIDILLCHKNRTKCETLLKKYIDHLIAIGFLTDHLAMPGKSGPGSLDERHFSGTKTNTAYNNTYMGMFKMEGYKHHRRIDIKVHLPEHYAFAILGFTGSEHFNRSIRHVAKKKGLTLSNTKLCEAFRGGSNGRTKVFTAKSIPCATEKDIFDALGLSYIKPTQRNTYQYFSEANALDSEDEDVQDLLQNLQDIPEDEEEDTE